MADYSSESVWAHYAQLVPNPTPILLQSSNTAAVVDPAEMETSQNQSQSQSQVSDENSEEYSATGNVMEGGGNPESESMTMPMIPGPGVPMNPEMDPIWKFFDPIYNSARNSIISATCKKCLLSFSSKPYRLRLHLINSKSCGDFATKTKTEGKEKNSESTVINHNKVGAPRDLPVTRTPPVKNSCFICGQVPKKRSKSSFESLNEYPPNWSRSIGSSLCQLLELDKDHEGSGEGHLLPRILASGIYCCTCAQAIRDINWIQRSISSLNSQLANLRDFVINRIRAGGSKSSQLGKHWDKAFVQSLNYRHEFQSSEAVLRVTPPPPSPLPSVEIKEEIEERDEGVQEISAREEYITADFNRDSDEEYQVPDEDRYPDTSGSEDSRASLPPKRAKRNEKKRAPARRRRSPKTTPARRHSPESNYKSSLKTLRRYAFPCPIDSCARKFVRPCKVDIHLRKDHEKEPLPYHCIVLGCGAKFCSRRNLFEHKQIHREQQKRDKEIGVRLELPCPIPECQRVFKDRRILNKHVQTVHLPRLQLRHCQFCAKSFRKRDTDEMEATEELIKTHESLHQSNPIPFSCVLESCTLSFQNSKELRRHVGSVHEENRFHCDNCPGTHFNSRKSLNEHRRRLHKITGEVFPCEHPGCKYSTIIKKNLDIHKQIHREGRPHQCDQCGMAYKSKRNLAAHFSIKHSEATPYKCPHCGAGFKSPRLLHMHEVTHTGNTPVHLCEGCGKQFVNASNLTTHARYRCPKGPQLASEDIQSYRNKCRDKTRAKRAAWRSLYGYDRLPPPNKGNPRKQRKANPHGADDSCHSGRDQKQNTEDPRLEMSETQAVFTAVESDVHFISYA